MLLLSQEITWLSKLSNNDDASFDIKINILNEHYFLTIQLNYTPEKYQCRQLISGLEIMKQYLMYSK